MKRNHRERTQIESKKSLEILGRDEKFWQERTEQLAKEFSISDEEVEISNDNEELIHHPEKVFCLRCKCNSCLMFRKLVIGVFGENKAYNDLWTKLRDIISSYYTMLTTEDDFPVVEKKYENLLKESYGIRWSSDGSIDVKKNIHASMGNFASNNDSTHQLIQTFIVVFNMLYTRDPHQLFELLCLQLTSIVLAYREGIKELTKSVDEDGKEFFKPEEFISYILSGYENITEVAETLSPLVSEMREHLEKFSLTWQLMNQCMYYRFLYVDIENHMAECIIRLKEAVDNETYKFFVYKFIKFDEEMTKVSKTWETALVALEKYRKSPSEVSRSERISMVNKIFEKIRHFDVAEDKVDVEKALPLDWIVSSEHDDFWMGVIDGIKHHEMSHRIKDSQQLCKCWACLMAEGSSSSLKKCSSSSESSENLDNSKDEDDRKYHLSWAVFKHFEDREPYERTFVNPECFCVFNNPPCTNVECLVAANLIIGSYPFSFTKFLLKNYHPLSDAERDKFLKVPSQSLIKKFSLTREGKTAKEIMEEAEEINHSFLLLNSFWDDDEDATDQNLRSGLASALAENFKSDMKFPQKHIIFSYFHALFQTSNDDISMDIDWLEKINMGKLFKSFGTIACDASNSNHVDGIEMTLKELKITAEMSADTSEALELVQMSMKEVAEKLSSFSIAEENGDSTKNVLENEIKKPLVEALKLAASNKKLEAELKSLQKEHNMLKDMVKGLEQIHDEKKEGTCDKTCSPNHQSHASSDSETSKENGNSSDCVCYYCTLFGKNQEANPRSTETRDRLRKRLHHLQNQKDHGKVKNLKNISFLLKNGKCNEKHPENCTHQPSQNVKPAPPAAPNPKLKAAELELQRKKKLAQNKVAQINKSEKVKIQRETGVNLDSVETLVEYIEGPSSKAVEEIRKAEEVAVKKQMKKQKQQELKVRKQIDEYVQEIKRFNDILHENAIEIKQNQHRLTQLKTGKGKNFEPKRVKAAEGRVMEVKSRKVNIEKQVKDLFNQIKELNPEVDLTQECYDMKYIITILHPSGNIPMKINKEKAQKIDIQIPQKHHQTNDFEQEPPKLQQKPQQMVVQQPQVTTKNSDDDPAKRMVTIRRINLPHSEPQVTVTAKGTTPDMDQLLYTFVNGQLVPASSLSQNSFQNGSIQLFMSSSSSNGQKKMISVDQVMKDNKIVENFSMEPITKVKDKAQKKEDKKKKKEEKKKLKVQEEQQQKKKDDIKTQVSSSKSTNAQKKQDSKEELKKKEKKSKKAFIDPEFASNPFTLLDDEGISSSEDESSQSDSDLVESTRKLSIDDSQSFNISKQNNKKSNQQQQQQKNDKNNKAKQTKSIERKDSVTSVTSSNASKDSKHSKKQAQKIVQDSKFAMPEQPPSSRVKTSPTIQPINSIMDQLSRGIRVEGLRLPPGITLTKVSSSDISSTKRDSINRITQPISDVAAAPQNMFEQYPNPNGLIMVESAPHAETNTAGKKRNKKKKNKGEETLQNNSSSADRIVTLKNPMFYNNNNSEPMNAMMRNLQTPPFISPMGEPQQASIIKNENGMYTIRNPTFQNSFGGGGGGAPSSNHQTSSYLGGPIGGFSSSSNEVTEISQPPRCSSVIGSEMKNMLQRRKEFAAMDAYHQYGMPPQQQQQQQPSTYQHFGNSNFDRNGTECENFDGGFNNKSSYPMMTNFEDLRSGQMLNSEVTIHNVKESKMFQNNMKRSQQQTIFGDLISSRPMPNSDMTSTNINGGGGGDWMHSNKAAVHHILTEDYEKRQNSSSHSNSPISVTSLTSEEIYDSDSKHQKLPSFYSAHHSYGHNDDKSSGASSLFSSGM